MHWVLPYIDQPPEFWQRVRSLVGTDKITVYFSMPGNIIGSGRPLQPDSFIHEFLALEDIRKSVLLNPIVHSKPAEQVFPLLRTEIERLMEQWGVAEAVLSSVGLARHVHDAFPDLQLSASTLLEISNPTQLLFLEELFDSLTPSGRIVRDEEAFRSLRKTFKGRIRMMVNEGCLPNCIYRTQHFFEMNSALRNPESLCAELLESKPWLALIGAWVLPQHLDFFDGLYDEIKLGGRVTLQNPERYLTVLKAYLRRLPLQLDEIGGGPATGVRDVPRISRTFYGYTLRCSKECITCEICRRYYEESHSEPENTCSNQGLSHPERG